MNNTARIYEVVKRRIVPTEQMKQTILARAEEIRVSVERECKKAGLPAEVRLDGSVAKDTWIHGYVDADIFMRVSTALTKKDLNDVCLPIAKRALRPNTTTERFAEHPYIESVIQFPTDSLRVNVVPCYNVEKGNWLSATDRTPYHTEYVRTHLKPEQHVEVRLLKAFMRGIGAYGADIKTGGFSGMIAETLIIARGSFENVLRDFKDWSEDRFIDVENYYEGRPAEIRRIFKDPLVVIDPVDKGRNLGAAVRSSQLWNFVAASRAFLQKPTTSIFAESETKPMTKSEFRTLASNRGSSMICISMGKIDAVVDIAWSQLFRTQRALSHLLENNDFEVIRSASWTDEKLLSVILFELASSELSPSKKRRGPHVSRVPESFSFIAKHVEAKGTVAGPWIEDGRWYVEKSRGVVSAHDLLKSVVRSGGTRIGVAQFVSKSFRRNARILAGSDIGTLMSTNHEFAKFMRTFLAGRPSWLV